MKNYLFVVIGALLFLTPAAEAALAEHPDCKSKNCLECHKMDKKDAEPILKKLKEAGNLPPGATVRDVKPAPAGGLWQIDLEADGRQGILYVDFSKKFLVPQIIPLEAIKRQEQRKIDFSKLPLKEALIMGPKNAKKKVAVFTDPDCPYCRKLHEEIKTLQSKRNDIAFYIFLRPLPMHKDAAKKAEAVLCSKSQAMLDDAMSGKAVPEPSCSTAKAQVDRINALADSLEFRGTPTMVREDGTVNPGYLPADQLAAWADGK
jgi:thiol:disulfide interchange protein DsbC